LNKITKEEDRRPISHKVPLQPGVHVQAPSLESQIAPFSQLQLFKQPLPYFVPLQSRKNNKKNFFLSNKINGGKEEILAQTTQGVVLGMQHTVDSFYLDYLLSQTSLYFEQKARTLGYLSSPLSFLFLDLSRSFSKSDPWIFI